MPIMGAKHMIMIAMLATNAILCVMMMIGLWVQCSVVTQRTGPFTEYDNCYLQEQLINEDKSDAEQAQAARDQRAARSSVFQRQIIFVQHSLVFGGALAAAAAVTITPRPNFALIGAASVALFWAANRAATVSRDQYRPDIIISSQPEDSVHYNRYDYEHDQQTKCVQLRPEQDSELVHDWTSFRIQNQWFVVQNLVFVVGNMLFITLTIMALYAMTRGFGKAASSTAVANVAAPVVATTADPFAPAWLTDSQ